jgi:hypothetical protein
MNQRDRQQAAKLIEAEFRNRRELLDADPDCKAMEKATSEIARELGLTQRISRLKRLKLQAEEMEAELQKRLGKETTCYRGWDDKLSSLAKARLKPSQREYSKLEKLRLRLLAKVETCESRERLTEIFKEAGLA